ncbi:hypothetical protein FF38_12942 [Lucilia cuprina]|uniref:Uncharacterized protein n=1 Tax=Lucilia cuprina TaxID=7375 RepID=A0A0L0BZN9_LUCCU|nr:hypothetical protein FF38_12942 [Lucilia cuprina]
MSTAEFVTIRGYETLYLISSVAQTECVGTLSLNYEMAQIKCLLRGPPGYYMLPLEGTTSYLLVLVFSLYPHEPLKLGELLTVRLSSREVKNAVIGNNMFSLYPHEPFKLTEWMHFIKQNLNYKMAQIKCLLRGPHSYYMMPLVKNLNYEMAQIKWLLRGQPGYYMMPLGQGEGDIMSYLIWYSLTFTERTPNIILVLVFSLYPHEPFKLREWVPFKGPSDDHTLRTTNLMKK